MSVRVVEVKQGSLTMALLFDSAASVPIPCPVFCDDSRNGAGAALVGWAFLSWLNGRGLNPLRMSRLELADAHSEFTSVWSPAAN